MSTPIDFYFDFSSPYGYFAATRIEALAAKYGRTVVWHPILLGAVFKVSGSAPLTSYPLKGQYALHDFARTAAFHGILYQAPAVFPLPTQNAARAMLWVRVEHGDAKAVEYAKAVYHAYFVDGKDISQAEVLAEMASELGLDAGAVAEGAGSAAIKEQLKADVDAAIAKGVFGSPFIVVDGEGYWGFDRFDQIEAQLQKSSSGMSKGYKSLLEQAAAEITTYSIEQARERLGKPDVVFVDVRDVRELEREGVIPGAFHAPRGMIEFWVDPQSPYFKPIFGEDKEFVFFCAAGWRSALTTKTVQDMGLKRVADIAGGFGAWKAAGAPVEEKAKKN